MFAHEDWDSNVHSTLILIEGPGHSTKHSSHSCFVNKKIWIFSSAEMHEMNVSILESFLEFLAQYIVHRPGFQHVIHPSFLKEGTDEIHHGNRCGENGFIVIQTLQ